MSARQNVFWFKAELGHRLLQLNNIKRLVHLNEVLFSGVSQFVYELLNCFLAIAYD